MSDDSDESENLDVDFADVLPIYSQSMNTNEQDTYVQVNYQGTFQA